MDGTRRNQCITKASRIIPTKCLHIVYPVKCYKIAIKDMGNDGMTDGDGSYVIGVDDNCSALEN